MGFEIIPAVDIIDGKCVRLIEGDFQQKTEYFDDPLDAALMFEKAGYGRLHIVDLDGAKSGEPRNIESLQRITANTSLSVDYGGGLKSEEHLEEVFSAGADLANIGTVAAKDPGLFAAWVREFGARKFLPGADVKGTSVFVRGWTEDSRIEVFDLLSRFSDLGIRSVFVTDIAMDGVMAGPSVDLYKSLISRFPELGIVASGGVRDLSDISELKRIGCAGAIVGKAFYEGDMQPEVAGYAG